MTNFDPFLRAFPPVSLASPLERSETASAVALGLGLEPPNELVEFWSTLGPGYYGENELYFFGDHDGVRHSIVSWNEFDFWRKAIPSPCEGGPLFFAETCFGEQIGFRRENDVCIPVLYIMDTMESFILGKDLTELFEVVLADQFSITDPARYSAVRDRLGQLPHGKHFAPIISPLLGGGGNAENFHLQDPAVHMTTAIAVYDAVKDLPKGTRVSELKLDFDE